MNAHDVELSAWRAAWTADEGPLPDAARMVARGRARMMRRMTIEAIVGIVWVGLAGVLAVTRPRPAILLLAGGIIVLVIVAMGFAIWNSRGAWRPLGASVHDFIELGIERCRRDLRAVRFGLWVSVVELILLLAWVAWNQDPDVLPEVSRRSRMWLIAPVLAPLGVWAWLLRWRVSAQRELRALERTKRSLADQA